MRWGMAPTNTTAPSLVGALPLHQCDGALRARSSPEAKRDVFDEADRRVCNRRQSLLDRWHAPGGTSLTAKMPLGERDTISRYPLAIIELSDAVMT